MHFIDLQAQYQHLKRGIDEKIATVLNHGKYIMGPEVNELEQKLAEYLGVKHAISCANGTDALQLCMMTLGINQGDAVFCPTFTFFASAEVIAFAGATPVFVDSDDQTFNICTIDLEKRIQKTIEEGKLTPRAILAVDLFGLPADYPKLEEISKKYNLELIEDAAQGFGGEINDKRAGSFGGIATTSFFPAKPLGCYGDGGAIFTNNDEYAQLIKSYRVHGKGVDKYDNIRIGVNSRLDTLQASILLEKLAAFPQEIGNRNQNAGLYTSALSSCLNTPFVPEGFSSSWAQYTLKSEMRDSYIEKLNKNGIPAMVYYDKCMHQQTAFSHLGYVEGSFPVAERLSKTVFSIPMHPYLTKNDIDSVISVLTEMEI